MKNPLVEKIEVLLKGLKIEGAILRCESYEEQHFGNACAEYAFGNLLLQFTRDRGDDLVDFLNPANPSEICSFDDISLVLGWKTLEELLKEGKRSSFVDPPNGPIPLENALSLINRNIELVDRMFSKDELPATLSRVREASTKRCKAFFG